jgi:hypothetical protein
MLCWFYRCIRATPDNHQAIIRQRSLQRLSFVLWRSHPCVAIFIGRQAPVLRTIGAG